MKIRTDFVTNSSSSSYCTIRINASDKQFSLDDVYRRDFMSFEFSDPSSELASIESASELLGIILGALGAWNGCLGSQNEDKLYEWLVSIDDVSKLSFIEIDVHEQGEGIPQADIQYYYDFKLAESFVSRDDLEWENDDINEDEDEDWDEDEDEEEYDD